MNRVLLRSIAAAAASLLLQAAAGAQDAAENAASAVVRAVEIADLKAVFATVESVNVVPARARIGGTVAELAVDEGDRVEADQAVAVVASETLALQIEAANARIQALAAQDAQAQTDLARAEDLAERGVLPRARLDEARTEAAVVGRQLQEARAQRNVLVEQVAEGAVLAPAAGRVLRVPVTVGTVVLPGEAVAELAVENYVLRLSLPERHARFIAEGDAVQVDPSALGGGEPRTATIVQVYPQIAEGRVIADASVEGLGDFFVGERVRVWVATDMRRTMTAPEHFIATRHGVDFVRVRGPEGEPVEARVQRGRALMVDGADAGVEILSGVAPGDELLAWDAAGDAVGARAP